MPLLNWLNRDETLKVSANVPYRVLTQKPELSYGDKDTQNMIIQGDNLEALKSLLPYYAGKVKCIFIDPPYNTKSFQNHHYDDNLEHSEWLNRIYPRLELLRALLENDGTIFVQIDDKEFARLYLIMCEIFGEAGMKTIAVKMSEPTGKKMASIKRAKGIPKLKEFIVIAKKTGKPVGFDLEKIPKSGWDYEYKTVVTNATKSELEFVKFVLEDEGRTSEDICLVDEILQKISFEPYNSICFRETGEKADENWLFENAWRIVQIATLTGGAREIAKEKKDTIANGNAAFSIITQRNKMYAIKADFNTSVDLSRCKLLFADLYLEVTPGDFWQDIKTTGLDNEGGIDFPNGKKPERLLKRIIEMASNPEDLILDSFLGSGTTAAVAHKMGRRYIGIEMGEHAKTHCAVRLRKVIDGEQGGISKAVNWNGGGGFNFYELGETIFDENGAINPNIKFENLAAHIWFYETKSAFSQGEKSPLLGIQDGVAYYLLYNGILGDKKVNGGNVLTTPLLKTLPAHNGPKIIYGEKCILNTARLKELDISFKQTPYDVKAR